MRYFVRRQQVVRIQPLDVVSTDKENALFLAEAAPSFRCKITFTSLETNCRAIDSVLSVEPSSTTMISFRDHVWLTADLMLSAIQASHCTQE